MKLVHACYEKLEKGDNSKGCFFKMLWIVTPFLPILFFALAGGKVWGVAGIYGQTEPSDQFWQMESALGVDDGLGEG